MGGEDLVGRIWSLNHDYVMIQANRAKEWKAVDMRNAVRHLVEHPYFTGFITLLILVNAVTLGMETDQEIMASIGPQLHAFDTAVLLVFTA